MEIDPDEIINHERATWNLIEKESFRRAFWILTKTVVHHPPGTTKVPLYDNLWFELPNTFKTLPEFYSTVEKYTPDFSVMKICESRIFLGRIQSIVRIAFQSTDSLSTNIKLLQEAKAISEDLKVWCMDITRLYPLNHIPTSRAAWFGISSHITLYSYVLFNYRFVLVRYLLKSKEIPTELHSKPSLVELFGDKILGDTIFAALNECKEASSKMMFILKEILIKHDPKCIYAFPPYVICFMQTLIFLGIVSQCDESTETKQNALNDYLLVKNYLRVMGDSFFGMANIMVDELEKIEKNGWENNFKKLLLFFIWDIGNVDGML
ncbi:hypothetical protein HK096_010421 [Nowakowskiella sp. JEL0078]|nr:hypothetical protein HK096_010421 [Nowakowskiella sp. JEL0078]